MFEVTLANSPKSSLDRARLFLTGSGFESLELSAIPESISQIYVSIPGDLFGFRLEVVSNNYSAFAEAKNIGTNDSLHVQAINEALYIGHIVHSSKASDKTPCVLRCSSDDPPVNGPTCINCEKNGVKIILCCYAT